MATKKAGAMADALKRRVPSEPMPNGSDLGDSGDPSEDDKAVEAMSTSDKVGAPESNTSSNSEAGEENDAMGELKDLENCVSSLPGAVQGEAMNLIDQLKNIFKDVKSGVTSSSMGSEESVPGGTGNSNLSEY
jgi:hypothetical protein